MAIESRNPNAISSSPTVAAAAVTIGRFQRAGALDRRVDSTERGSWAVTPWVFRSNLTVLIDSIAPDTAPATALAFAGRFR